MAVTRRTLAFLLYGTLLLPVLLVNGCSSDSVPVNPNPVVDETEVLSETSSEESPEVADAKVGETETAAETTVDVAADVQPTADQLLAMRLPRSESAEGWIRLFDGHSLFGWEGGEGSNFRVEDGAIVVDSGKQSLLCTTIGWTDYELTLEYRADAETNSGVFLRTPMTGLQPDKNCYEVNIAPADNPFPTASVVQRIKVDASKELAKSDSGWQRMTMRLQGGHLQVSIGDELVCDYTDENPLVIGRIGLQKNSGRIAFRDIRLKPLGLKSLIDPELSMWTRYPEMEGEYSVTDEGAIRVKGGKTQLESKQRYGDFTLLAEYKMEDAKMNSGIFFRSIPGDVMMGYECQVSNEMIDDDRSKPADCGAGGVFRRQDARVVAGDAAEWNTIVFAARGNRMAGWVGGIQVSDIIDDRKADPNPRRGLRLEPGTLMIQGHDATTDALYRQFSIAGDAALE